MSAEQEARDVEAEPYMPTTEQVRNNMAFGVACAFVALRKPDDAMADAMRDIDWPMPGLRLNAKAEFDAWLAAERARDGETIAGLRGEVERLRAGLLAASGYAEADAEGNYPGTQGYRAVMAEARADAAEAEASRYKRGYYETEAEIEVIVGRALGWHKEQPDDPGYSEGRESYSTGDHVPETMVAALARALSVAEARVLAVEAERDDYRDNPRDEHHTMAEVYDYRMLYNAHAARGWLNAGVPVVKSRRHSDGEPCFGGGWFIVTATLPTGQVSNHYRDKNWDLFDVPEVDLPPEYDGHAPADAASRLRAALATPEPTVQDEEK